MPKLKRSQFKFRRNDNVGAEGAEQDGEFLEDCFYDQGDIELLTATTKPNCIIVGRTGSGKTALLRELMEKEDHVVEIDPDGLSLQYLSNFAILRQLESLGVNLGLFYKLLWRHIFAVELIKAKYNLKSETETKSWVDIFLRMIGKNKAKERAIKYLLDWGRSFWEDTEYRVKEVVTRLEKEVKGSVSGKLLKVIEGSLSDSEKLTVEERAEVVAHAQKAVDSIQVRELIEVLKILAEDVFDSLQPRYYITIDKLDENWVEDHLRYRLIKALVESVKEINHRLTSVKIVLAIRRDLLDRVIQQTRDAGFQEEKYHPLYVNLRWTKEQLLELLDKRIGKVVARQYTTAPVSWKDLLVEKVNQEPIGQFMIARTMYRPRDLIVLFNHCIQQAVGTPDITAKMVLTAEANYSQSRLQSLRDELDVDYPEILQCAELLKKQPPRFQASDLSLEAVKEKCLALVVAQGTRRGVISDWSTQVIEESLTPEEYRLRLICVFYRVGLVGLKLETFVSDSWSFSHTTTVSEAQLRDDCTIVICPMFYRALGIKPE